jgi:hypothetical protein
MRQHHSLVAVTLSAFLAVSLQAPAVAATIGTRDLVAGSIATTPDRATTLARVHAVLDRDDVRAALEARGVSPADAAARVAALSDAELAGLADQLDTLPAGGDLLAVIGIVFVVLLILELTGVTDIFKKI